MADRRPATDEEARALASATRLRILRICFDEARTNKEIAELLDRGPASTLHHVRTLVRTGFLEPQPTRRGKRGARELPYLATDKSWHLSTPQVSRSMLDAFLAELDLVPPDDVDTTRLGLRLSSADMVQFRSRLQDLLDDFAGRPDDPCAPAWSVFVSLHPDPNRPPSRPIDADRAVTMDHTPRTS